MRRTITAKMPVEPKYLRVEAPKGGNEGVDRTAKRLNGFVVAQRGVFKDQRGEFDRDGLADIVTLMTANDREGGTKSHFTHGNLSDDGLGTFLGRAKNPRLDGDLVRADLHFAASAFDTPRGDLAGYVLRLADEDPDAISSSLVLSVDEKFRLDDKGVPLEDDDGLPLPPLWVPLEIHGSDVVKIGAAVDGILSTGGPDELVVIATEYMDKAFENGCARELVESRCKGFLRRYLDGRFGAKKTRTTRDQVDKTRLRLHNVVNS